MAVPNDRRIVYGTFVVPQISYSTSDTSETQEEGCIVHGKDGAVGGRESYTDYKLDTITNTTTGASLKYLGGKSSGTDHVQITHDQGADEWTSMISLCQTWGSLSTDELWNTTAMVWGESLSEVAVDDSLSRLMPGSATTAVQFLYIKNLGSVECQLALEGDEQDILIPSGASVAMRTTSTVTLATIKVGTASGDTTIEYVIAI